eukprot:scaffold96312_cov30-Tisochrysis_lutea.AAC.3
MSHMPPLNRFPSRYEFAETEKFLAAAEDITGHPYVWGRYDILCMPPSFPYGGMENPCLTFVTPTLLAGARWTHYPSRTWGRPRSARAAPHRARVAACNMTWRVRSTLDAGDRSLADVVAHEVSHSWTGNLITNATWEHFWLNEVTHLSHDGGWSDSTGHFIAQACECPSATNYDRVRAPTLHRAGLCGWSERSRLVSRGARRTSTFPPSKASPILKTQSTHLVSSRWKLLHRGSSEPDGAQLDGAS